MAITLADFNKIWASTSPLTPYSFSEANYKRGWNFIGATPPARQMWDSYMKASDEKDQWLYNNKLSLSGGTMTGGIVTSTIDFIKRNLNDDRLAFMGGTTYADSASLLLFGGEAPDEPGTFQLRAQDGTVSKTLKGRTDGTLTWDNNAIATTNNTVNLTGDQTIGGVKTFTSNPAITKASPQLTLKDTAIERGNAPAANYQLVEIQGMDKSDNRTWGLYHTYSTTKDNSVRLLAYNGNTTDFIHAALGVGCNADGNPYTIAPTPVKDSNDTNIATTAFVKANLADYLPLSGGTMTGGIATSTIDFIRRNLNDDRLAFMGGTTYANSASLLLFGGDAQNEPGTFQLRAQDGVTSKTLKGRTDGILTWDNNALLTAGNYSSYALSLAGGTMTGTITSSSYDAMSQNVDNSGLRFSGGASANSGASLALFGQNNANYPGQFAVRAYNGTLSAYLTGYPDGTLTWAGKNVERVNASGAGYIRYDSGLQICWGSNTDNTIPQAVLFPQAFNEVPSISISNGIFNTTAWSKTGFTISAATGHTAPATVYFKYIAVGFWK